MASVPDDAAALDVPCPHCGERPVQQAAKNYRLAGFLLAWQVKRDTQIGCAPCTKAKSRKSALITLFTGWWSITSAILNPFAILFNLGRSFVNRGPSASLVETLEETGLEVEFLSDPDEFDPDAHIPHEAMVTGLVQLGCAVMLADGDADPGEAESIRDELVGLSPEITEADLEELIERTARDPPSVAEVGDALNELLTEEGKDVAIGMAARVAAADGDIDDAEVRLIQSLGEELDMEVDAEEVEALVELASAVQEADLDEESPLESAA